MVVTHRLLPPPIRGIRNRYEQRAADIPRRHEQVRRIEIGAQAPNPIRL